MLTRKRCTKCKAFKDRKLFTIDNSRKDKLYPQCKMCLKKYRELPDVKQRRYEYSMEYKLLD